jgi:hypothetical protein
VILHGKVLVPAILGAVSSHEDIAEVPAGFAWVFYNAGTGATLLRTCIARELANTDQISLLFREETAYVRTISSFIQVCPCMCHYAIASQYRYQCQLY